MVGPAARSSASVKGGPRVSEFRRRLQVWKRTVVPAAVVLLLMIALLPIAIESTLGAAFALAVVTGLTVLLIAGFEHTAELLLVLGFALSPLNDVRPVAAIGFVTASDVFLVAGIGILAPGLLGRGFRPQATFVIGAVGVVSMGLVSAAVNPDPAASLNVMLRLVVGALMLPVVFTIWRPRHAVVVALAAAYVAGNVINVAAAMINQVSSYENRYIGLSQHPNILGICAMLGLSLVPFLIQEIPKRFAWLAIGAALICMYGIWISGSRAALLVGAVLVALYPLLARSITAALLIFGLSIAPIYLVGKSLVSGEVENNILGRFLGGGSATASDQAREELLTHALDRFTSHPLFGVGFGQILDAHNIYLQIAAAGGVAVLVFYVALLVSVVLRGFQIGPRYRMLALPAMGYAMIGPITPLLWDRYIWCVLALPFLVMLAPRTPPLQESPTPELVMSKGRP